VPRPCRRSDFDVTDTVQVSRPAAVREAVLELYADTWPGAPRETLEAALRDFEKLFTGQAPGYLGVDTVYHDLQHSQDVVLATARLLAGYERSHPDGPKIGAERALVTLIVALFHDSGYIRETGEAAISNGAVFTRNHVTRSARYLAKYLPGAGLAGWVPIATRIVHFTGYETPVAQINVPDPIYRLIGSLLGSADIIAQMADRCYLEKCRDRLYPEFVAGGITVRRTEAGGEEVVFASAEDLLRKTPSFYQNASRRLDQDLGGAYQYAQTHFGGQNLYMDAVQQNIRFMERAKDQPQIVLRRQPPSTCIKED